MKRLLYFPDWQLRWKFLFIFLALVMIPMIAFSLFIYSQANQAIQLQAIDNTKSHLEKVEDNMSAAILSIEDISSYMIYSNDFRTFLTTPSTPENQIRLKHLEERINGYVVFHLNSKPYLDSITLTGLHNSRIHIGTPLEKNEEGVWERKAKALYGKVFWSEAYTITDDWGRKKKVVSLFRVINDINNITRPIGLVTIRLDAAKLYQLIETDSKSLQQTFVLDHNQKVVLHHDPSLIGKTYPDKKFMNMTLQQKEQGGSFLYEKESEQYHVVTQPLEGTDLVLVAIVDKANVAEGLKKIMDSIIMMMVVLTLFGILAMAGFYHFNIKRIVRLTEQTRQVEKGDFSANVLVHSRDEIGLLGLRFNKMVERIQHLIEKEYKMEIRSREADLKLLQSQINPHFLYNTLDMIRWTARLENAMDTSKLIEQLSKMFRISLNRGKPWITLEAELTYSQSYLALQKRRLGKKLEFTLYCEAGIMEAQVLKQLIQPLIENSLQHGFENMRKIRKIYIRCFQEENRLVIDVMDNGKGFSPEEAASAMRGGFALQNIQDRLTSAYGDRGALEIRKKESGGAWVRLVFPFDADKSEGDCYDAESVDCGR
ncbi:sensor histidine kinase [Fictibacillus enclensis]|uniref:sensor histidine kinase n=1 Tax=Fictibacillus enclensis TaxID=1017270 RepID=UPI0025A1501E|nr:sensor histidine kinase [Fictibacillus enclensis]MDM5340205.1 sensor histidine kinase [Fictibacillus enclensis]